MIEYECALICLHLSHVLTNMQRMENKARKQIALRDEIMMRAIWRVWKAGERGRLLERVRSSRLISNAFAVWQQRLAQQRELQGTFANLSKHGHELTILQRAHLLSTPDLRRRLLSSPSGPGASTTRPTRTPMHTLSSTTPPSSSSTPSANGAAPSTTTPRTTAARAKPTSSSQPAAPGRCGARNSPSGRGCASWPSWSSNGAARSLGTGWRGRRSKGGRRWRSSSCRIG